VVDSLWTSRSYDLARFIGCEDEYWSRAASRTSSVRPCGSAALDELAAS